eukprot:SAG11_NODE_20556_length_443_cov_0.671512_1_plen_86_part_01
MKQGTIQTLLASRTASEFEDMFAAAVAAERSICAVDYELDVSREPAPTLEDLVPWNFREGDTVVGLSAASAWPDAKGAPALSAEQR